MKDKQEIIEEMQKVAEQMRIDDIEENPDIENEFFDCDCCGEYKGLAGSIQYGNHRLCNDCVLIAETSFALGKIKDIEELINAMEDTKLENMCEFIKHEESRKLN